MENYFWTSRYVGPAPVSHFWLEGAEFGGFCTGWDVVRLIPNEPTDIRVIVPYGQKIESVSGYEVENLNPKLGTFMIHPRPGDIRLRLTFITDL